LIANSDKIHHPEKTINAQRMRRENLHVVGAFLVKENGSVPIPIEGETDTMDTFVDSSLYFIRYCEPNNETELRAKDKYKQVDLYVGGDEHVAMHLICARFINMFFSYDIGVVYRKNNLSRRVTHQGTILNEGEKMSKSKGDTINPDNYDQVMYCVFI
jgi:leucyl-tRNA synthetase